jgi:ATP-dependent helicase/nuclease subunit B
MHASNIYRGGHSLREHTFIVGLDDGRFPGAGIQDPVILDRERENLSPELPTAAGRLAWKLESFARLIARLRGTVTLSYTCRNLLDDREMFPSPVILSAFRIISGKKSGDYNDLTQWLEPPASFAPRRMEQSLDMTEWWLGKLCPADGAENSRDLVTRHFPHLSRGIQAADNRKSSTFTEYDGRIIIPGPELDPLSPDGPVVSANRLEAVGKCALAYFFKYVLELKPPEDLAINLEQWLSPLEFGTLLHEVFYDFISKAMRRSRPPDCPADLPEIHSLAAARAQSLREAYPPASEGPFLRQLNQLLDACAVFLREEARLKGRRPLYLEAAIGVSSHGKATEIDSKAPVEITVPGYGSVRVAARLDRVDQIGPPESLEVAICDYKSGSSSKYEHPDPFWQGRIVQHALYIRVLEKALRRRSGRGAVVRDFSYFFPGARDRGLRRVYRPGDLEESSLILANLCRIVASGRFLATTDSEADCKFCDYTTICRDTAEVAASSRRKLEDEENISLKPMKELRSRE